MRNASSEKIAARVGNSAVEKKKDVVLGETGEEKIEKCQRIRIVYVSGEKKRNKTF